MGTSDFLFDVPINILISVPVREKNAEFAVAQAQGRIEFLFEMLDGLKYGVDGMARDEIIKKIEGFWEDMTVISVEEGVHG